MRRDGWLGERSVTSTGWLTPDTGSWNVPSRISGASAGVGRDDPVAERARHGVAPAVAACLRHGHPAAGQHHASGSQWPLVRGDHKPSISWRDMGCTLGMPEPHAGLCGLVEQRIEHRGGAVRIGEQLPVRLFVERDAELVEEPHGIVHRQGSQHPRNRPRRSTVEVPGGHDAIRDVTAAAAADENLGAKASRPIDDDDVGSRCEASGRDRGHQPGRATANDNESGRSLLSCSS